MLQKHLLSLFKFSLGLFWFRIQEGWLLDRTYIILVRTRFRMLQILYSFYVILFCCSMLRIDASENVLWVWSHTHWRLFLEAKAKRRVFASNLVVVLRICKTLLYHCSLVFLTRSRKIKLWLVSNLLKWEFVRSSLVNWSFVKLLETNDRKRVYNSTTMLIWVNKHLLLFALVELYYTLEQNVFY